MGPARTIRRRYCGSSPARPRYGIARTPRAIPGHLFGHQCHSLTPTFINALGGREAACRRYCQVKLELGDGAYGGIAHWGGEQQWVEIEVREAYKHLYPIIRPALCRIRGGGGVALKTLLKVAAAMAAAADHKTGQNSRLKNDTLMERTGYCKSTVQRAKLALKMLGVATEVLRGRLRRRSERLGSWRVGDKSRGWASVWALHPRKPVDKTRRSDGGSIKMAPHHPWGHLLSLPSLREVLTTKGSVDKRAAPRRPETKEEIERAALIRKGALLAARWLGHPQTPAWARRHTARGWARALADAAAHGWTADDLNTTLADWARERRIAANPTTPIAFMRWLMKSQDLQFPPHLLAQIALEQERAAQERRAAQLEAERGRYADAADVDSPGRRAARSIVRRASIAARHRKAEVLARENAARAEWITHRRNADARQASEGADE